MNTNQHHAREQMRRDIYKAIRRNLVTLNVTISRHEVVVILAEILAEQIEVISDEARKQHRTA
jgi:hypothetical protein